MPSNGRKEITLRGIPASPGICIGKAYLVDHEGVNIVKKYTVSADRVEAEVERFNAAVWKSREELTEIMRDTPEEFRENVDILETQTILLKDKMLYEKTLETIEKEHVNAEWALKKVVSNLKALFQTLSDPYFRERTVDIEHVANRIMRNLVGVPEVNLRDIEKRVILVASDLTPAQTSQIQLDRIKGFATDMGGMTSHTAIIARTMGIPALLGLGDATRLIRNDDIIVLDGAAGVLVVDPSDQTLLAFEERREAFEHRRKEIAVGCYDSADTCDGMHIQVMGNIELPGEVRSVTEYGGDGIGLYRTEFQYLGRSEFPTEDELFERYREIVAALTPRPVVIRTLDINGDKAISPYAESQERIPPLGLRAIRYCLKRPDVFKTQLRAILRAAVHGENVRILLPMISNVEEVRRTKALLKESADELAQKNQPMNPDIRLGVMVEVPSAAVMADVIAAEVDFFSIGTNDLIQYTFAVDRGNRHLIHLSDHLNPAVLRLCKIVVDAAQKSEIPVFMCGEMAADPLSVPLLVGLGIDELSMSPPSIPVVKHVIRQIDAVECRKTVKRVLDLPDTESVRAHLTKFYGDIVEDAAIYPATDAPVTSKRTT
jgi:phosphotransferase system enzyme I (PtsI)